MLEITHLTGGEEYNRDSRGHSYLTVRGEMKGFVKDETTESKQRRTLYQEEVLYRIVSIQYSRDNSYENRTFK